MKDLIKETIDNWKRELLIAFVFIFLIMEIFFYKSGIKPLIMAASLFIFVLIPGILLASLIFQQRFSRTELTIIGFGFGMVITPFLIYFINIFEVLHAKYLAFIIPLLLIPLLGWLNIRYKKVHHKKSE